MKNEEKVVSGEPLRKLTGHVVNPANDRITITVMDPPGSGGAHHHYSIDVAGSENGCDLVFQNGPIAEAGVNGITHEALLAVLIDRLECFQGGPFANDYNRDALQYLRGAQSILQVRTRDRMARGVEGTHTV